MKKKYIIVVLVLVFSSLPGFVYAQEDQTNPVRLEREKRVSERIDRLQTKLSDEEKSLYKARCRGAQTKVSAHLDNAERFSEKHDKKFDDFLDRITKLVNKLNSNGHDVAAVQAALDKAIKANKEVKSAYESYILALKDTTEINCQVDPEGFRASIDEAKQEFAKLIKLRNEVRKSIKEDVKTALQSVVVN